MIRRGELWWADFEEPRGPAPGWRRPVLVVQADVYNLSRLRTIIVVALTTNTRLANAPGNVFVAAPTGGLSRDSVVNVTQLGTFDEEDLDQRIGTLPDHLMSEVDRGLVRVLGLR